VASTRFEEEAPTSATATLAAFDTNRPEFRRVLFVAQVQRQALAALDATRAAGNRAGFVVLATIGQEGGDVLAKGRFSIQALVKSRCG
jgi:hypothetical protein